MKTLSVTLTRIRYRGYYYDTETGLYYLNARYYDPEVGRFISADETLSGGYNLFEYCKNNTINGCDFEGKVPTAALLNFIRRRPGLRRDCLHSFYDHIEVGCIIYEKNGVYECGETTDGISDAGWSPDIAEMTHKTTYEGYTAVAFWHTHPFKENAYSYCLSDGDVKVGKGEKVLVFSHAANGEIFGYDPSDDTYYHSTDSIRDIKFLDSHLLVRGISEQGFIAELDKMFRNTIIYSPHRQDHRTGNIKWIYF